MVIAANVQQRAKKTFAVNRPFRFTRLNQSNMVVTPKRDCQTCACLSYTFKAVEIRKVGTVGGRSDTSNSSIQQHHISDDSTGVVRPGDYCIATYDGGQAESNASVLATSAGSTLASGEATGVNILVSPTTGEIQGLVDHPTSFRFIFSAVNQKDQNRSSVLEDVNMTFKFVDLDSDSNGPNGFGCGPNGNAQEAQFGFGEWEFDGKFECSCLSGYTGENCQTRVDTAEYCTGKNCQTRVYTAAFWFGSLVLPLLIASLAAFFIATKYKAYVQANAPADFTAHLEAMVANGEMDAEQIDLAAIPREMKRGWLRMVDRLGAGHFGEVWKGVLDDGDYPDVPA